jgi:anti-sigma regulatory factor (Ser/Thr protein kinase)
MVDVLRGALAEVEEYPRVRLRTADRAALAGRAVGDVTHLIAELMENAVTFSPPRTSVYVTGSIVAVGYLVEIEDRGLGMSSDDMREANKQISAPPEFHLSSTARLGFYVVGRLAQRHNVKVELRRSAYDGVTASVLIPLDLLDDILGSGLDQPRERLRASMTAAVAAVPALPEAPRALNGAPAPAPRAVATTQLEQEFTPAGLPLRVRKPVSPVPKPRDTPDPSTDLDQGLPNGPPRRSPDSSPPM